MDQEIKEYIKSKKNKVSEKQVLFKDFLEYVKIFEQDDSINNTKRKNVGFRVHKEMVKDE